MIRHLAAVAIALCLSPSWLYAQTTRLTVTAPSADVHASPGIGSAVIGKAPRGSVLVVTRELGSWVRIVWPGGKNSAAFMHVSRGTIARNVPPNGGRATASSSPASRPAPAGAPVANTRSATPRTAQLPVPTRTPEPQAEPVYVTPNTHVVGLGARLGDSTNGFGASVRAWRHQDVGFQLVLSRSALTGLVVPERLASVDIEPSVLWSLPDHVSNYLWVRPYLGSGATVRRQTLSTAIPGAADPTTDIGLGFLAFGGAEFTVASVSRFALSADLSYRWSRMAATGFDLGGLGFALSGHWYVK